MELFADRLYEAIASTFERGELEPLSQHLDDPVTWVGSARSRVLVDRGEIIKELASVRKSCVAAGMVSVVKTIVSFRTCRPGLCCVRLVWTHLDAQGRKVAEFHNSDVLRAAGEGYRIIMHFSHDTEPGGGAIGPILN